MNRQANHRTHGYVGRMQETYPAGQFPDRTIFNTYDAANRLTLGGRKGVRLFMLTFSIILPRICADETRIFSLDMFGCFRSEEGVWTQARRLSYFWPFFSR